MKAATYRKNWDRKEFLFQEADSIRNQSEGDYWNQMRKLGLFSTAPTRAQVIRRLETEALKIKKRLERAYDKAYLLHAQGQGSELLSSYLKAQGR